MAPSNFMPDSQVAQTPDHDLVAVPAWRSAADGTSQLVIRLARGTLLVWRVPWFLVRHPVLTTACGLLIFVWWELGWAGLLCLVLLAVAACTGLRMLRPDWFAWCFAGPARDLWRRWFYHRRWHAAMTLSGLAPVYQSRALVPALSHVSAGDAVDLVTVGLVTGQAPADFADRADNLAHAFGAQRCRVRRGWPGMVVLEFVRADTLAAPMAALPYPDTVDLSGLPLGRCENGAPWLLRLLGTHVLIAGATGSGKGSVIWSAVRAMLPGILGGWVEIWALDPKRMELSFGRALFARYADDREAMVGLLEAAVREMHARAARFGGIRRTFAPSAEFPFLVLIIDELAFVATHQPDCDPRGRALCQRGEAAIATLTGQGRPLGVCVVGALQDPRKDLIGLRRLFPTRMALRLDESDQVDMVLGNGARGRGALADEISPFPGVGAGVGYVWLEAAPDPVRVRAAYVTDDDIRAMAAACRWYRAGQPER